MVLAVLRLVLLPIYSVNTLVPLLLVVVAAGYELSGLLVMDINLVCRPQTSTFSRLLFGGSRAYVIKVIKKLVYQPS